MRFDCQREFSEIKSYIEKQITNADKFQNVSFLDIGFGIDQGGLVKAFIDYRKDAAPDGSWTMHLESDVLERSHWPLLCEEYDYEELVKKIGELIKKVMFAIRDEGKFNSLNKNPKCEFGIEEINGEFGWPYYDERGSINCV